MQMGLGLGITRQQGGANAIASALATRAGISWRPDLYATTLFTDAGGTVAATGPGDVIYVQKCPVKTGAQFVQATLANRPILVRHPKRGRVNELVSSATMTTQNVTTTAAQRTLSIMGTGTVTLTGTSTAGPLIGTGAGNRVSLTFTPTAGALTLTVSGSVTAAQLQLGAAFDSLQTVSANGYDITESGQSSCWGLYHDGVNDSMATAASLDLSASDKVAVFQGLYVPSTPSGTQILLETAPNWVAIDGTIVSDITTAMQLEFGAKGTIVAAYSSITTAAPVNLVHTGVGHISGDNIRVRLNGSQIINATADMGTGNFGNAVIHKCARGGASLFFNGIDFGGCIISGLDATTDAAIIAAIERQIAANTPTVSL